ncbi:RagB/SusD family nutrient uptake outer membrane protein [Pedobacter nyackensis]|uniref:RagB/SusD family nutrient uptake outer membrane protein n=1 Tax=Pedobacter nyackensis TaxID=475255 RepID=UPI00292D2C37|nr:RagB/SusD family nutrient uptake outer membrane protein [Pedobacter nyackensis]
MKIIGKLRYLYIVSLLLTFQSCSKDWLEAKPDKSLIVAGSIKDYQALLDNSVLFNTFQAVGLGEIAAGDFYITPSAWDALFNVQERSAYIWEETANFYKGERSLDWENGYKRILNANIILEGIEKVKPAGNEQQEWNNVKGSALFFRAFDFYNLAQEYCMVYRPGTGIKDLGLPLRLESDVNVNMKRSNLQRTYDQIIADLKIAAGLLGTRPLYKTRPSKEAVYALMSRTFLSMENYDEAEVYANLALQIQSDLMDYAKINNVGTYPISRFNSEVIFHSTFSYGIFITSRQTVVSALYADYAPLDCRKSLFFTTNANGMTFRGNYTGDRNLFAGLATDELYLIRAECNARKDKTSLALADLNLLRRNRWKGNYQDLESIDPEVVLGYVLKERRKELLFRGLRWSDLRRLNRDNRFAVTLNRTLNANTYTLQPNDGRYVFPIDEEELRLSEIEQNPR